MDLPNHFTEEMKRLLGEEYDAFLASYGEMPRAGLRLNTRRGTAEETHSRLPFSLTKVPWISNGYYYTKADTPAKHPYYYAGLYYLQEPSAMTPASLLPVQPGDRVLDLCAAPGGKATELGSKLQGKGCLFANDISNSRAKALLKNLELFGIDNCMVTSETPERLAEVYPGYFDKILIDAPCSGEGMFRKDPGMVKSYAEKGPAYYAELQRTILTQVVKMLRPGGMLLYSTCTFSPLENEASIQFLLDLDPTLHIIPVSSYEGFAPGRPDWIENGDPSLAGCVRIWPHRMEGEGHFAALLQKEDNMMTVSCRREDSSSTLYQSLADVTGNDDTAKTNDRITKDRTDNESTIQCRVENIEFFADRKSKNRAGKVRSSGGGNKKQASPGKGTERRGGSLPQEAADFLASIGDPLAEVLADSTVMVKENRVYVLPSGIQAASGIRYLRTGLYVGDIGKKGQFEPSQALAMTLSAATCPCSINLPVSDDRVIRYLKGETLDVDDLAAPKAKGWQLVCVDGFALGWGKLSGGTLKNKYCTGWRWM